MEGNFGVPVYSRFCAQRNAMHSVVIMLLLPCGEDYMP